MEYCRNICDGMQGRNALTGFNLISTQYHNQIINLFNDVSMPCRALTSFLQELFNKIEEAKGMCQCPVGL